MSINTIVWGENIHEQTNAVVREIYPDGMLPTQFALDLQLLGGLWILQTLPALVFGLYTGWFRAPALLAGWAAGFTGGSALVWSDGLKPLHALAFDGITVSVYTGLLALALNVVVAVVVNLVVPAKETADDRLAVAEAE